MKNDFERLLKLMISKPACGIGYIIVPPDVDRGEYIETCFRTETVSMYPEVGGTSYNNVPLALSALQDIEFPEEGDTFGSQVVYLLHPLQRTPIILAVVDKSDEMKDVGWKQFLLSKENHGDMVQVRGDARKGFLLFKVLSSSSSGGNIIVQLFKKDGTGKMTVQVQGDIIVYAKNSTIRCEDTFNIKAVNKIDFRLYDDSSIIEIEKDIIRLNGGENEGVVNARAIRSLAQALLQDLLILGSGTNLSKWMGSDMVNELTDKKFTH